MLHACEVLTSQVRIGWAVSGCDCGHINAFLFPQHFISQREEFETARDSILVWLTEMDLQLTNIEHFSECDVQAKIKQLKVMSQLFLQTISMEECWKGEGLQILLCRAE